ncbi:two component transcriptional regulator, LuxR family [Denitrovibrio acetiphilus DSM 12809]|uniref:Two component transcriptional regulator, LuxR family n=1 Tax=Denitrovibrio acetiphilus (strain DSM 12809 / NBRC 114555 / N2460) TaxID=522772 RepID=D4H597_DENA2|nr:response regulator transcription factor [Denitrovibrio acetiphilus]ADD67517.1 two component transcriptional regulator, LuxR family [Denitrovibrio acetiphilus DSM 12809]
MNKEIRVSIVDDNIELSESLSSILRSEPGVELIDTYPNAEMALSGIADSPCDILIVDINLPGASGIELIQQLVSRQIETQFLVYTIHDGNEYLFKALKAGASGYILKGTPAIQITNSVRLLHDGGSPMTPSIARKVISFFQDKPFNNDENRLTKREVEVLKLLDQGFTYNEVSAELDISRNTVHTHIKKIYEKLQASGKEDALRKARYKSIL